MWIGFFLFLLSAVSIAIISFNVTKNLEQAKYANAIHTCEENVWTPYMIVIPEVLSGIGLFFSITGQIEFMLAQAPQSMQGILIGIMFVEFVFPYITNYIGIVTTAGTRWSYYVSIAGVQMISLILYSITAYKYKYRQTNELSDINARATIIEEIYTRELEKEYEPTV